MRNRISTNDLFIHTHASFEKSIFVLNFKECFDKRDVTNTTGMFDAIIDHIKYSYNGGTIRPAITIFRKREIGKPDLRVWNPLMAHFAGYKVNSNQYQNVELSDSSSLKEIGDQGNLEFTEVIKFTKNKENEIRFYIILYHEIFVVALF